MTLAIALANSDQIIQVSDRRLTISGRVFDDSSNKAGHIIAHDAAALVCYTGLSQVSKRHKTTMGWIMELFDRSYNRQDDFLEVIYKFADHAEDFFRSSGYLKSISPEDKRLTIMISGYYGDMRIFNALVTNFQDFNNNVDYSVAQQSFNVLPMISRNDPNPTLIQYIGNYHALRDSDIKSLRSMLENHVPGDVIANHAARLVQEIADRPEAQSLIGKKINTARINSDQPFIPISGFSSDSLEDTVHLIDQIDLSAGGAALSNITIQSQDGPILFPVVHRNAPCPCGSGKRYRNCHRVR